LRFRLDGRDVELDGDDVSLLEALRDGLGVTSPKDGCSPQGQCGCCTVLVDGQPRVACVTPARRVAGREVTTVAGLAADERAAWA
jgi:aerobic-type carbon monoxide dehydrogenase small subunit (CoxS/CutS family)